MMDSKEPGHLGWLAERRATSIESVTPERTDKVELFFDWLRTEDFEQKDISQKIAWLKSTPFEGFMDFFIKMNGLLVLGEKVNPKKWKPTHNIYSIATLLELDPPKGILPCFQKVHTKITRELSQDNLKKNITKLYAATTYGHMLEEEGNGRQARALYAIFTRNGIPEEHHLNIAHRPPNITEFQQTLSLMTIARMYQEHIDKTTAFDFVNMNTHEQDGLISVPLHDIGSQLKGNRLAGNMAFVQYLAAHQTLFGDSKLDTKNEIWLNELNQEQSSTYHSKYEALRKEFFFGIQTTIDLNPEFAVNELESAMTCDTDPMRASIL